MKVIPLSKAKTNLSQYAHLCHQEPVVVTINGVPAFQLVPIEEEDDLIDRLIKYHPKFKQKLAARLKERSVPVKTALRRLGHSGRGK
ncbi:MAG: type II toxin-antitoxin system Phd/YefM family antitoxin [Planctomycetes bacterium]|nr:type II toxin-antitoxin system Phd/YefM family antitoxin [Planctomycetota bacterium]